MEYGICMLSAVPVRIAPQDQSEMVTQLLFGNLVQVTGKKGNWLNIRIIDDGYEGWIDEKQLEFVENDIFEELNSQAVFTVNELVSVVENSDDKTLLPVVFGAQVRLKNDNSFQIGDMTFSFDGLARDASLKPSLSELLTNAGLFSGAPYMWGGKSPFGIDCSGFTQILFQSIGVMLLRDAGQQATQGETISLIDEARPGDLLFFDNDEGAIVHVGILLDEREIIHASGKVRIDTIDHQGIYNKSKRKYTHQLRLIKRIL